MTVALITLLLSPPILAQKVGLKSKLGFSCFSCALNWDFGCPNVVLPLNCRCDSDDFLTTALACVVDNSLDVTDVVKGWGYVKAQCHYWGNRTMSMEDLQNIYLDNKPRLVSSNDLNGTDTLAPGPVRIPREFFTSQMVSAKDTKHHYNVGNYFAWAIVGYWALIMIGGIVTNAIRVLCPSFYDIFGPGRVTWIRKYLTIPALAGKRHHSSYNIWRFVSIKLPTRGQFLIILGFVAINLAGLLSFFDVSGESPLMFISTSDRKLHYLANRTGIIAFGHIPILVLFACRNNPFIYLTSWPYDTFMTYHRWCARAMGTHAIIHAIAIYWSSIDEHVVAFKWRNVHNWRGGNLAVYSVIIMLIFAIRAIRTRIYELFKATHVLLFWIFMACAIVHCSDYGWLGWLWTAVAIYLTDYVIRVTAVIMAGGLQDAEFKLGEAGMYRVRIRGEHRKWAIKPGSYVYIQILDLDHFWQSHPFSIFPGFSGRSCNSLDLCCKAQMGATQKMLQKLRDAPNGILRRKVLIEGPYGCENYICDYDSILLFSGGVGFTAMYNFASHILERLGGKQELCLYWVVRDSKHLRVFEEELGFLARNMCDRCTLKIFVTKPEQIELGTVRLAGSLNTESTNFDESDTGSCSSPRSFDTSKVTLVETGRKDERTAQGEPTFQRQSYEDHEDLYNIVVDGDIPLYTEYGRPDIAAGVSDFMKTANGSKAIVSCGPPLFVDAIRNAIVKSILVSDSRVDYFEDAFSW